MNGRSVWGPVLTESLAGAKSRCVACSVAICVLWAAVDGEQKMGSKYEALGWSSGGREDRTGGQVSGFTALCGTPGLERAGLLLCRCNCSQ